MTLIVNLFGGPGSRKSTTAEGISYHLKSQGVRTELVQEFAKDKVWEESYNVLENQIYVYGEQHHRIFRLLNKVDVIVTDSPMLLSIIYGAKYSDAFKQLVVEEYKKLNNINFLLRRTGEYDNSGRMHTEEQSRQIDLDIENMLRNNTVEFTSCVPEESTARTIASLIIHKLNNVKS